MVKTTEISLVRNKYDQSDKRMTHNKPGGSLRVNFEKQKRVLFSIPLSLMDAIDQIVRDEHYDNRSELIRSLLRDKVRDHECLLMQKRQNMGTLTTED